LTVVSGDSRGKTSFWNGKTGTLADSYQSHKADVLAVAVSADQQVHIF
jgi:U3 small nucleolar RNA-associated protein 4